MMISYKWLGKTMLPLPAGNLEAMNRLMQQLSPNSPKLDDTIIAHVAAIKNMHLIMALDDGADGKLVGMARVVLVPMLVGFEGVIEDVVVDPQYRGNGIGRRLVTLLLERAKESGAKRVVLTTWPDRKEAVRLYEGLGFAHLPVNYYRKNLI